MQVDQLQQQEINNNQFFQGEPFLELNDLIQVQEGQIDPNAPSLDDEDVLGILDEHPDLIPENIDEDIAIGAGQGAVEDEIDASSDSSDEEGDLPAFNLNEPIHVELFIPMDGDEQLMINPEEFPEDELMDHFSSEDMQLDDVPLQDNNGLQNELPHEAAVEIPKPDLKYLRYMPT